MENNKITQAQLDRIGFVKREAIEIASALGELNYQKILLDMQIEDLKSKIVDLRSTERAIFEELRSQYGNINVNLETGEYTVMQ